MRILITGSDSTLGKALAARLADRHELRSASEPAELIHPERAAALVAGVDAVAHLAEYERVEVGSHAEEARLLERASRGAFVLGHEALKAGVKRIVVASRLELMTDHPADCVVDETWRPNPRADAASLAPWMAELTLGELVRAEALHGIALRMSPELTTLDHALAALERALTMELPERGYRWRLYHIDSTGRFPMQEAGKPPLALALT